MKKDYPTPDHAKLVKNIVYKLTDTDDATEPILYFTLNGLRNHVINVLWPKWDDVMGENQAQEFTQEEIYEKDEFMLAYLDCWNYKVERITILDLK